MGGLLLVETANQLILPAKLGVFFKEKPNKKMIRFNPAINIHKHP